MKWCVEIASNFFRYFNENHSGGIVSKLINDITLAQNMVGQALTTIWMDGAVIIVLAVVMFRMDWVLTLVTMSIFPAYFYFNKTLGKLVKRNRRQIQDEIEAMSGDLQEKISGYIVVKSFAREKAEQRRFFKTSRKLLNLSVYSSRLSSLNLVTVGFMTSVMPIIVVLVAGFRVLAGDITIGELVVFSSYLASFYFPVNRFSELNVVYSSSMAAIERIFEVFDKNPEVQDKDYAVECAKNINADLEFKDVSFSYDEGNDVLKNINLKIEAGNKVALVGSSGSGKTTINNLISRFYDPVQGAILLNGNDLRDYKVKSLRQNIGVVMQESILFSGSIEDNIRYGDLKAGSDEIYEAARQANAYNFINELPEGFDTEVGERGVKLSGGQKQRISIARVFIKNPKILILDEATSALDSESENLIQNALDKLMAGRTTIIIAHRLSTIMSADVIVAMENGEIAETGTHKELLARNGVYRKLYDEQFKHILGIESSNFAKL